MAREIGVEFALASEVEEILFAGRRAVGVRTAAGVRRADAVVVNADFARAMQRSCPTACAGAGRDRRIAGKHFSCSTFMLYLGIDGRYDDLPHHTIHIASDYRRTWRRSRTSTSFPRTRPSTSRTRRDRPDAGAARASTLYVLVPVTHRHPNVDWRREAGPFRARVLSELGEIGLGDVRRRIRFERVVTPVDWDQAFEVHLGATFNLAHDLSQMLHLRPAQPLRGRRRPSIWSVAARIPAAVCR